MQNKMMDYLIMYYEIKRLYEDEHYSLRRISDYLGLNFRTVKKYLSMDSQEFESFIESRMERPFLLEPYKEYLVHYLQEHPDTPASVIHDKLKEYFYCFPQVHPKTVYNYVSKLRSEYGISKTGGFFPLPIFHPGSRARSILGKRNCAAATGTSRVFTFSRWSFVTAATSLSCSATSVSLHKRPWMPTKRHLSFSAASPVKSFTTRIVFSSMMKTGGIT